MYVADENYEEISTPYHMIFGRNTDDNCTTGFYEMTSDNDWANFSMQKNYFLYLKSVSRQSTLYLYRVYLYIFLVML